MQHRHKCILDLIKNNALGDQQSLINALNNTYSIECNQTAISRDLQYLGVVKEKINGKWQYRQTNGDTLSQMLKLAVVNIEHNEVQIVISTLPGTAAIVADYLDASDDLAILGTISGETAVFVCPKSTTKIQKITKQIAKILQFKESVEK